MEINYDNKSRMIKGFPLIKKLGAVSPNGESTPFEFNGRLYRLELSDPSRGTDMNVPICAIIRDRETFCKNKGLIRKTPWPNVYSPNNALR